MSKILDADSPDACAGLDCTQLENLANASGYFAALCRAAGRHEWADEAEARAHRYSRYASDAIAAQTIH